MRFHACIVVIWCVVLVRGARDRSFQERSNSGKLLRQNAEPMYPLGAFDKTVPERNSLPQGLHLGALETGYPSDNEHLNHHRFATLKRQQAEMRSDRGLGQITGIVQAPKDPPVPPKYNPKDYFLDDRRDYTKASGSKDPLDATFPMPSCTSVTPLRSSEFNAYRFVCPEVHVSLYHLSP